MSCRRCSATLPPDAVFCHLCGLKQTVEHKSRTRPNGTGTAYRRGKTWTAKISIKNMAQDGPDFLQLTHGGFKTRTEALRYCEQLKAAYTGTKRPDTVTFKSLYDEWYDIHAPKVTPSATNVYRCAVQHFKRLYALPFNTINLTHLQSCIDGMTAGRAMKIKAKALASMLFDYALPRHLTDLNYARFIELGNTSTGTYKPFSRAQIKAISEAVGRVLMADYVLVLIYTGFRPGELFSLTTDSYDAVNHALIGGSKTEAGRDRLVPIAKPIDGIIRDRISRTTPQCPWLFPTPAGRKMTVTVFSSKYFSGILSGIGIDPDGFVPYSCRHTFANLLKDVSGSDKDKAGIIGHEKYGTTQRLYQSAEISAMQKIVDQL